MKIRNAQLNRARRRRLINQLTVTIRLSPWQIGIGIALSCILFFSIMKIHLAQAHAQTLGVKQHVSGHVAKASPSVTPVVYTPTQEKIISLIEKVWGEKDSPIGIAISSCESSLDPDKVNYNTDGSVDYQVFQVNTVHGVILDTEENVSYAYKLFKEQGTTPWDSSSDCWRQKI